VVDLELGDLFVLVGCDGDERGLVERIGVERVPAHAEDVVRLHHVDPRLVLVHRVQYDLHTTLTSSSYFDPLPAAVRTSAMCLSVCLSVRSHNSTTTQPNFTKILRTLPMTVARSFSGGAETGLVYVLPVLWMTSRFHIVALRHVMSRRQNTINITAEMDIGPIYWTKSYQ